jgi:hypothetical protein
MRHTGLIPYLHVHARQIGAIAPRLFMARNYQYTTFSNGQRCERVHGPRARPAVIYIYPSVMRYKVLFGGENLDRDHKKR